MLSHYRLVEKIGEGGMGVVWKAVDTKLDREVAIKILPDAFSQDPTRLGRFKREAKAVAALNHPNIVTIHSVEDAENVHFITMELVQGQPLKALIPTTGMTLTRFLNIAVPLVEAISAAHQKGITHRDLKPDNIMVGDDGSLRVLDFGLARLRRDTPAPDTTTLSQQTLTQEGHILGTVPYMSPEQVQGKTVDHRTDIFALGIIFYEMLSGQRPFQGATSVDLMSSILKDTPSSVTDIRPDLPGQAGRLVARCLEKAAIARFQATVDLGHELEGLKKESEKESIPSIAVLPLVNMSADPEQEYFCDGIAEDIINGLTQLAGMRVAARTSAFAFKGKKDDMREIGKKLDVDTLLEGSVRKVGNRIRVTAQLINVADGYHLWSERYDRKLTDVFAIQDEIAMNIVRALEVELTDKEKRAMEKVSTRNVEAYDFYLRGRQFFYMGRQRTFMHAIEMFERAAQKDPDYALAYAGMADCYSWLYMYHQKDRAILDQSLKASQRSLELDPELAEAHAARGLAVSLDEQYAEAERAFEQAIHLNPRLFEAYYFYGRYFYGRNCRDQSKWERAAELFEKAAEVRPEDYQAACFLASALGATNRKADSDAAYCEALKRVQKHLEFNPDDARALYMRAHALMSLGEREQAFEWAQRALSIDPEDSLVLYNVACIYSIARNVDEGIRYLEKSVDAGFAFRHGIENDIDFESIRDHPRYQALIKRLE